MGADDRRFRVHAIRTRIDRDGIREELSHTGSKPLVPNQAIADDVLERTLDRYLDAKEQIDNKSAAVLPAVAAIGALVSVRLNSSAPIPSLTYFLVVAVGFGAALAVVLSIWALAAEPHSIAPDPREFVGGTDLPEEEKRR